MVHHFAVSKYTENGNLLGSGQGRRILEGIQEELKKLPAGGALLVDFENIRYSTSDCLTEMFNVIDKLKQPKFQDNYVILKLESTNISLEDSIISVLKENSNVIPSVDEKGKWKVLGELTKAQKDTLEIIREKGEVTSTEISELLAILISAASNRLKDLYDMKLVMRTERILPTGGRQFVYQLCCPEDEFTS